MWVHKWNPVTCRLDLVQMTVGAAKLLRPLGVVVALSCGGIPPSDAHGPPPGPPTFAHSPPPPAEYTPPEYPGYPAIPGTPIGGYPPAWGYTPPPISTPPIFAGGFIPPRQHVETFTPAVISTPPEQHVETFTPAVITELCDTPPTIIPPDCDTVPAVSHVPEPSGLLVIGTALFTLGVILMAARSKTVVPHIRWVVLINGEAES